jgi:hypothetical protein
LEGGEGSEGLYQTPAQKLQRLRYRFDEELEEDQEGQREPQRFKGFLDESQYSSTPANTSGGGTSYAIMIYDVSALNSLSSLSLEGQEERVQTGAS